MLESFKKGEPLNVKREVNGIKTLTSVIPLPNEQRCKSCHPETGYVGAIMLTTSMAEGYDSAKKLALLQCIVGAICFLADCWLDVPVFPSDHHQKHYQRFK